MRLLRNAVRPYAWGSRTALAEFTGRPSPSDHPEAELWMGAHPGDPSRVAGPDGGEQSLLELIDADPAGQLGPQVARRFSDRLPFLLKVLAAEEPLSLQAHPSAEQAAEGYAREEELGIPRKAAHRNYPDPTPKPELVCALTEFHAMAGFAPAERTVELLRALDSAELAKSAGLLAGQPDANGLRALFTTWITMPQQHLDELLPAVLKACAEHVDAGGEFTEHCRTALELADRHPGDAGVLASLLMNRLTLQPGEAIFLPAGNLHMYLRGMAIELQGNSDNVLRGGLTPKHVDVPELLRVLDFTCREMPVSTGEPDAQEPRMRVYRTPAPEFELSRIEWSGGDTDEVVLSGGRPQIVLCSEGSIVLRGERELTVPRGRSVWLPASEPPVAVRPAESAGAQVFRATTG
jgi:mannose-6-phosphate isomerase